jgi:BON domain
LQFPLFSTFSKLPGQLLWYPGRALKVYDMKKDEPVNTDDIRIQKDILALLHEDAKTDATRMEVEVKDAEVLLKGRADTEEEKQHAGQIAGTVPGVKKVENHLHIDLGIAHALSFLVAQIASEEEDKKEATGNKGESAH